MSKTVNKVVSIAIIAAMMLTVLLSTGCVKKPAGTDEYTYRSYATALGSNWNPHTWDTNADQSMLGYVSSPFVDISILDSEKGIYQWVFEMATAITDVTKDHQDDLTKYKVTLPAGQTTATEGYVFEIALNPNAKWENGTAINADSYMESMLRLLDPDMKNYRANLYLSGESALAGAFNYYYSKDEGFYVPLSGYKTNADAIAAGVTLYLDMHGFWGLNAEGCVDANGKACPQYVPVTDTTKYRDVSVKEGESGDWVSAADLYAAYGAHLEVGAQYASNILVYKTNENVGFKFDGVGLYKVDDYTIRYVCQTAIGYNYFLTACTDTWLVYVPLYDELKDYSGALVTTKYGTSKETTMSYGTYKMESLQDKKQVVFVQNENWYGWTEEDGKLVSYTNFEVDGQKRQQYKTTKIVIDVLDEAAAKAAFLKGELSEWSPSAEELSTYNLSEQLYKVDETYTMSFFFNTGLDALKEMDKSKGNTNSVVLSNTNFRKAFSLAIDRTEFVTATQSYKPAYAILNSLYYYDIYDDDKNDGVSGPESQYRATDAAMQAICNLYGVEYGAGKAYETLEAAYKSISGYNLTEAKALMKTACDELVAANLYKAGDAITIKIGWAKGALTSDDNKQLELMNKYINAAIEGSGFGKITLEAVGNIQDRYGDVPKGEYAIGYGAWGGAAFYPFRNFQCYMDPDEYTVNETGCYDPTKDTLTLKVDGKDVTMTWQAWSKSMIGTGPYAGLSNSEKLEITAQLEEAFLKTYYRIPLCATTICSMLSYQCSYYTEEYNIMYGFGGLRLMDYTYDDADWAAFVAGQIGENGELDYQ